MASNPVRIPHTNRQRITTRSSAVMDRQYVYMPPESWAALQRLCYASHQSGSQVIQSLISIADLGARVKDKTNDTASSSKN